MRVGMVLIVACVTTVATNSASAVEITVEAMRRASKGADMTAAIQRVFNEVNRAAGTDADGQPRGTGIITFAPGEYTVGSLYVGRSIARISGYGAILKTKPFAGSSNRVFNLSWDSNRDSHLITIEGFHFDMNRDEQGWKGGHDLSHQAAIFCTGRTHHNRSGRLNMLVKDCTFTDSVADGVYVHHQVNMKLQDCIARDCFRGGLVITGDRAEVDVSNYLSISNDLRTGIDIEPNSINHPVSVRLNNVRMMGSVLDLGLTPGSSLVANNLHCTEPILLFNRGDCQISNSVFEVTSEFSINMAGCTSFSNCRFVATRRGPRGGGSGARTIRTVNITWNRSSLNRDQCVIFNGCRFVTDDSIQDEDLVAAVYCGADAARLNNRLVLNNCSIDGKFDVGITHDRGGTWVLQNNYINATTAYMPVFTVDFYYNILLNGNTLGPNVKTYWNTYQDYPENRVTHQNTVLTDKQNRFSTGRGMWRVGTNTYLGGRIIYGENDPTKTATPGLPGDVYVQSPTIRWVCTRGDYARASWQPAGVAQILSKTMQASGETNLLLQSEPKATSTSKTLFGTSSR